MLESCLSSNGLGLTPSVLFKADPEEAATPQHVRNLGKNSERDATTVKGRGSAAPLTRFLSRPQEDDIDGEHIIAFAEESDPGKRSKKDERTAEIRVAAVIQECFR